MLAPSAHPRDRLPLPEFLVPHRRLCVEVLLSTDGEAAGSTLPCGRRSPHSCRRSHTLATAHRTSLCSRSKSRLHFIFASVVTGVFMLVGDTATESSVGWQPSGCPCQSELPPLFHWPGHHVAHRIIVREGGCLRDESFSGN